MLLLRGQGGLFRGLLGGDGLLHFLLIGGQLFLIGSQGVFGGALCPLNLLQGSGVLRVKGVQLVLLVFQGLLQLGHFVHLGLALFPFRAGRFHIGLQLVHQVLVMGGHVLNHFRAGGELAEAVGVQQDLQGADVARGVQGHQTLFELVDGVLDLRLRGVQLHGQLGDALVQVINILAGGVDLLLHHLNLLLQGVLISLLFRLLVAKVVQLALQVFLFRLKPVLLGLDLSHGLSRGAQRGDTGHAQGHQPTAQPLFPAFFHKALPPFCKVKLNAFFT